MSHIFSDRLGYDMPSDHCIELEEARVPEQLAIE
jgi:hypothetical protein